MVIFDSYVKFPEGNFKLQKQHPRQNPTVKLSGIVRHVVATPIVVVDVLLWRIVVDEEVVMDRTDLHDPKLRRNRFGTPGSISDLVTECNHSVISIYIYIYIYIRLDLYLYHMNHKHIM